ncbi:MAG: hypothetical protein ACOC1K_01925 [Nanoarchaeota archaeon]
MNDENMFENEQESLDDKVNQYTNYRRKSDEDKSKETYKLRQNTEELFKERRDKRLDDDVEDNKEIYESLNDSSDFKTRAYDFLSEVLGVDMYKNANKREIKKAYKLIDEVNKDIKSLEQVLNGDELYNPPKTNNEAILDYFSSIDPKRKGLHFKFNESEEITVMFRHQELEHEAYIKDYEGQIEKLDDQIKNLQEENNIDKIKELTQEKLEYKRKIDSHTRDLDGIHNDLDKYIIKTKQIHNKIYEFENALNACRALSNNMEISLSIIGPDHLSIEGKTLNHAVENLTNLEKKGEQFNKLIEVYASKKNSKTQNIYARAEQIARTSNGEEIYKKIIDKNKSAFNYTKANMKAMRDTYFKDIGY